MNFWKFCIFTFAGAFLWCIPLTWAGYRWGADWEEFRDKARIADYPIVLFILALVGWYVWHKVSEIRHEGRQVEHEPIEELG